MNSIKNIETELITMVKEKGDYDGNSYIFFFDNLNDACNIGEYTDILAAFVGTDGLLSFLISDRNDTTQTFESIFAFDLDTINKIQKQIFLA